MKNNILEAIFCPQKTKKDSRTLLTNCGFSPNFFYDLEQNALALEKCHIKKIKSANDIKLLQMQEERVHQKKIYEAEDKDIFNKMYHETKNNIYLNYNSSSSINNNFSSYTTIPSQDGLNKNINEIGNKKSKYAVNAYKSKHKKKYIKLYEINSLTLEEKNKYKLYHKCCYPNCNRTFSSSGWLKAHLKEHLKQIHNSKYCKLFEKFIINEKIQSMNKRNNFYYNNMIIKSNLDLSNSNQNINTDNTKNNKCLFYSGINSSTPPRILFDSEQIFKGENISLSFHNFNNDNYKMKHQ